MSEALRTLAGIYGIESGYTSESGQYRATSDETRRALLTALGVPADTDAEVARGLSAAPPEQPAAGIAIARAYRPDWLEQTRAWGLTCQLYGVVSNRNWGMGDFEDLAGLAEIAGARGADFLGVNPLHALFPADPNRFSPYAPSDRRFLNPLYIAPDTVPEFADAAARLELLLTERAALRATELIDYPSVSRLKGKALAILYGAFRRLPDTHPRRRSFAVFRRRGGDRLQRHCLFEAIGQHFAHKGVGAAWSQWPPAWRRTDSAEVAAFARANADTIGFYAWLQWVAEAQLGEAQARALAAGMHLGLYLDLAVGVAPDGSTTWADPELAIAAAEIGAPPDPLAPGGQQWGLAPLSPARLKATGLAALRDVLAATMRHAGAVRIDHAMGLQRLFWIPSGGKAADGAYMRYPTADMFQAVAEVSRDQRCLVIGEDLGTVPEGFRERMAEAGLFAYRVLYFERGEGGRFKAGGEHGADCLICASTHDLPTLRGWWTGGDIAWRERLGIATPADAERQRHERARDRVLLLEALQEAGLAPAGGDEGHGADGELDAALLAAIHRFLARSACRLMAVQLDDALGVGEQANLPGTTDEHPNWRRRMPVALEELGRHPLFEAVTRAAAQERPRRAAT